MKVNDLIKKLLVTTTLGCLTVTSIANAGEKGINSSFGFNTDKHLKFLASYKINDWSTIGYEFTGKIGEEGNSIFSALLESKGYSKLASFAKKNKRHKIILDLKYDKLYESNFTVEGNFKLFGHGNLGLIYDYSNDSFSRILKAGASYDIFNLDATFGLNTIIGNVIFGGSYNIKNGVGLEIGLNKSCKNRVLGLCGFTSFLTQYSPINKIPKIVHRTKINYTDEKEIISTSLKVKSSLNWVTIARRHDINYIIRTNTIGNNIVFLNIDITPSIDVKINNNLSIESECTIDGLKAFKELPTCRIGINVSF